MSLSRNAATDSISPTRSTDLGTVRRLTGDFTGAARDLEKA